MELAIALLAIGIIVAGCLTLQIRARLHKLEWWIHSLEARKADKAECTEREVLDGDEWKHEIVGDEEEGE